MVTGPRLRQINSIGRRVLPALGACMVGFAAIPLHAQTAPASYSRRILAAVKLPAAIKPPVLDGRLDDPAWKVAATAAPFIDPQTGQPAGEGTTAFIIYDDAFIYVAFHCVDSHPDAIVARETVRDAGLYNDDNVTFNINPFATYQGQDTSSFQVNARGTEATGIGGGRASKVEWQGKWTASAARVRDGWTAEMRIPWEILSYPSSHGPVTMEINFQRHEEREHVDSVWSNIGNEGYQNLDGRWEGVIPPSRGWKPRLSLLPYSLTGVGRTETATDSDPSSSPNNSSTNTSPSAHFFGTGHFGLDARYQPTPQLTGVATINPDFSTVEGAVEGIGFTRSERFVPERRPFFLDGRDYLRQGAGYEIGDLFDSVKIPQFDAGAKIYGSIGPQYTLGALGTYARDLRSSNMVTEIRRNLSPTSSANMILLHHGARGEENTVAAIAPNIRSGKWGFDGQAIATSGDGAGGGAWNADFSFQDRTLFNSFQWRQVAPGFLDRLGYIPFIDYRGFQGYHDWNAQWRTGPYRSFDLSLSPVFDWHSDGRPFRRQLDFGGNVTTRSDYNLGFDISGGKFDQQMDLLYSVYLGGNVSNRFHQWNLSASTGKQADIAYSSFAPSFQLRVLKKLDLNLSSFLQEYQGFTDQHILTFNYEISATRSWGGRVVVQNGDTNWYVGYRNAGHTGTETYLIIGDPNAARFTQQILLKFVFAIS